MDVSSMFFTGCTGIALAVFLTSPAYASDDTLRDEASDLADDGIKLDVSAWKCSPHASIDDGILTVELSEAGSADARAEFDLAQFEGCGFEAEVRCRGENVSAPEKSWLGFKFMAAITLAGGGRAWPQTPRLEGTFGWKTVSFVCSEKKFDPEHSKGSLVLGLQDGSGRVQFDLSSVRLRKVSPPWPRENEKIVCKYTKRVTDMPRLRGVMLPQRDCTEDDFKTLHDWGATLVRFQMVRNWSKRNDNQDLDEYDAWLDSRLASLDGIVLPMAEKYGIRVIVDLHVAPGGRGGSEMNMFHELRYADHFIECWKRIAARFKGRGAIYGYDLINEPVQQMRALPDSDYWNLQRRAAEAVREIDPDTPIVIEVNGWDSPNGFDGFAPLDMKDVIYQVHMYSPHEFTHQGVGSHGWTKAKYPDAGKGWNRDYMRRQFEPVAEFRRRHGARILVGEFSAIAWGEGAGDYIADCIDMFEEYGFDWTYHAFREWNGWSVEHECDAPGTPFRESADNPRRRALLDGLRR